MSFTKKIILLILAVFFIPATTYLVNILITSSIVKEKYIKAIDEYEKSEEEKVEYVIKEETKRLVKRVALDVANELNLFLASHPDMDSVQLFNNVSFKEIATQPLGKTGYIFTVDTANGKILSDNPPPKEALELGLKGGFANKVLDDLCIYGNPVETKSRDGHRFDVVAVDNFSSHLEPLMRRTHLDATKNILGIIETRRTGELISTSLVLSVVLAAALLFISILALRKATSSLKELSKAASLVGKGDFDINVKKFSNDEFGELAGAFNKMADALEQTVVSRDYYQQAREAAEEALKVRSEFLANVSHEIRTPLNGIMGMTEVLLDEETNEERRHYLNVIRQCGDDLLTLINDILDISKIEAGKLEVTKSEVLLLEAIQGATIAVGHALKEKGLEFILDIDMSTPDKILTDRVRLRQVLINLLDNAIKFTNSGHVKLAVVPYSGPKRGDILFMVEDTGLGIPKEASNMIFEEFVQAANHLTKAHKGTGLGLAISAKLVDLLGGEIWLESEMGKGSRFYFTIDARSKKHEA